MKIIFFTLLLLNNWMIYSQDNKFIEYNYQIDQAEHSDSLGNYKESLAFYDSAFSLIEYYPSEYFSAFQVSIKDSNIELAIKYLDKGTTKGLDIANWYGDQLDYFLATEKGQLYLTRKDSLLNIHFNSIDLNCFNLFKELYDKDQGLRNVRTPLNKMIEVDSLNFEALIHYSEEYGFPVFRTCGYGENKAWILLWHHRGEEYPNSDQWQRILPYIQKRIDEGELHPDYLKMWDEYTY